MFSFYWSICMLDPRLAINRWIWWSAWLIFPPFVDFHPVREGYDTFIKLLTRLYLLYFITFFLSTTPDLMLYNSYVTGLFEFFFLNRPRIGELMMREICPCVFVRGLLQALLFIDVDTSSIIFKRDLKILPSCMSIIVRRNN